MANIVSWNTDSASSPNGLAWDLKSNTTLGVSDSGRTCMQFTGAGVEGSKGYVLSNGYGDGFTVALGGVYYHRWWMRFDNAFTWSVANKTKASRWAASGAGPALMTGYLLQGGIGPGEHDDVDSTGFQTDQGRGVGGEGPFIGYNFEPSTNATIKSWHEYILKFTIHSVTNALDGRLDFYVDGVLKGSLTGVRWWLNTRAVKEIWAPFMMAPFDQAFANGAKLYIDDVSLDTTWNSTTFSDPSSVTLFSTDFEIGAIDTIFPDSLPVNTSKYIIQSSLVHHGTKAFKFNPDGGPSDSPVKFITPSTTVCYRKWMWYPSTIQGGTGNHMFRLSKRGTLNFLDYEFDPVVGGGASWGIDILGHNESPVIDIALHNIVNFPTNQWFFFEMLIVLGTKGVANGQFKIGINGVQAYSNTTLFLRQANSTMNGIDTYLHATNWDTNHGGTLDYWYDDEVVITNSASDFLGPSGSPPTNILWSWDFESGQGDFPTKFDINNPGNPGISIVTAGTGANPTVHPGSVGNKLLYYDSSAGGAPHDARGSFNAVSSTLYCRWFYYFPTTILSDQVGDHPFRIGRDGGTHQENQDWGIATRSAGSSNITFNLDILDVPNGNSASTYHNLGINFSPSTWHKFEQVYILNSPAGTANGTMKFWVDGVLVFSSTTVIFKYAGSTWTGWDSINLTSNMDSGGTGTVWWIDDVYISDNITDQGGGGSGGGGGGTAPVLTSQSAGTPTEGGAIGASVSTTGSDGTLYWAVVSNNGTYTIPQIKAGVGGSIVGGKAGNQVVSVGGTQTIPTFADLNPNTTYQIIFLHTNAATLDSLTSSVNLVTLSVASGSIIWRDDVEANLLPQYYELNTNPGGSSTFGRATTAAFSGVYALKSVAQTGIQSAGGAWIGFGKLPVPAAPPFDWPVFSVPPGVDTTSVFTDVTVTIRHMVPSGYNQSGNTKFLRMSVFAGHKPGDIDGGSQAAALHIWTQDSNTEVLFLDPTSGVVGSTVTTTGWNDISPPPSQGGHGFEFLGIQSGTTHIYSTANNGHWFIIKVRMKLNTPGLSNGIMEYWVDGVREINVTNLNWIGSYPLTYGINTVHVERYWNNGAPANNISYFDDIVITGLTAGGTGGSTGVGTATSAWFRV